MESLRRFSVVVPTYARPHQLATCLDALAAQDYPRDRYEVVVVDDGSPEPPTTQVEKVADGLDVTLVSQRRAGPAAARNAGAARASGKLLAFTDDDCAPEAGWLTALAAGLERDPDAMVGGRTVNVLTCNPYSTAAQAIITHLYAYYNREGAGRFLASNNMGLSQEGFREAGKFDTRFPRAAAEDRDLCERWLRSGKRIAFEPDAVVRHSHALTLRRFLRQQFEYGRGAYWYQRFRLAAGGEPLRPEPIRFYTDLLRVPYVENAQRPLVVAGLIGLSQVSNAVGFAWENARPRRSADVTSG
jgi:GT2 family glycosyltransferase